MTWAPTSDSASAPGRATVTSVTAFPVADQLDEPYGSARGMQSARSATVVRIQASNGVVGWGECFGPPLAIVHLVDEYAQALVGEPLGLIEPFVAHQLHRTYHLGYGGLHVCALSAIDVARWDAWGKTLGVSVGELLGGRTRETVRAYASTGFVRAGHDLDRFHAEVAGAVTEGFQAVKVKMGIGLPADLERAAAARDAVGDGVLMVDLNATGTADTTRRLLDAIGEYDVYWLEEPVPPNDLGGYAALRGCGVTIVGGEALYTRFGFRDAIAGRLLDVVQPDVSRCGGFTEAKAVADLARTWNVHVSPHEFGGGISQAATLQLLAAIPDYSRSEAWFEFDRGPNRLRETVLVDPIKAVDGEVAIPDGPGLGVDVDEDALHELCIGPKVERKG